MFVGVLPSERASQISERQEQMSKKQWRLFEQQRRHSGKHEAMIRFIQYRSR
jgi:hypothetical protein